MDRSGLCRRAESSSKAPEGEFRAIAATQAGTTRDRNLLAPYVLRLAIDWMGNASEPLTALSTGPWPSSTCPGSKLSEGLAKHGMFGAKEPSATIGECFVNFLDTAYANGGRSLKFGGDALLLLFSGVDHETRACRAAYEMRRTRRSVVG